MKDQLQTAVALGSVCDYLGELVDAISHGPGEAYDRGLAAGIRLALDSCPPLWPDSRSGPLWSGKGPSPV